MHQDRDKGVVTLTGTTASDSDGGQAESIAKSLASSEVISDQIAARPTGEESTAKTVDSDIEKGIETNFDALLVKHELDHTTGFRIGAIVAKSNSPRARKGTIRICPHDAPARDVPGMCFHAPKHLDTRRAGTRQLALPHQFRIRRSATGSYLAAVDVSRAGSANRYESNAPISLARSPCTLSSFLESVSTSFQSPLLRSSQKWTKNQISGDDLN